MGFSRGRPSDDQAHARGTHQADYRRQSDAGLVEFSDVALREVLVAGGRSVVACCLAGGVRRLEPSHQVPRRRDDRPSSVRRWIGASSRLQPCRRALDLSAFSEQARGERSLGSAFRDPTSPPPAASHSDRPGLGRPQRDLRKETFGILGLGRCSFGFSGAIVVQVEWVLRMDSRLRLSYVGDP